MTDAPKSASTMTPQELAEACAAAMWADDLASQRLGMKLVSVSPGKATLAMEIVESMANGHGDCHGGYTFALADSAFAFACNSFNQRVVGQQANITYLAPVSVGDVLTATGHEKFRKGRSGVYDIEVTNQRGDLVAVFRGHSRTIKGTHLPE
jgi:acyl-CoA thioesterase